MSLLQDNLTDTSDLVDSKSGHSVTQSDFELQEVVTAKSKLEKQLQLTTDINRQLVVVIRQLEQLLTKEGSLSNPLIQEQIDIGILLGGVLESGRSIDGMIGHYLISAKKEARAIVQQALALSDALSESSLSIVEPYSQRGSSKRIRREARSKTEKPLQALNEYQQQLVKVAIASEEACFHLNNLLDGQTQTMSQQESNQKKEDKM
ncbi:hypothetical protein I6N95_24780 [Vagococcus sp. BWB3-3]|uniref:Uncharacterized protein n=1 Tax=Vagococcus allomyrinae TaxID=2794353 RepID=A0A940PG40_9ENTE|nr:hypothetical protein [Vagococcus allomyrinae]MBP1044229.1 hypothetical protein [Vagococcus allomyrinae]